VLESTFSGWLEPERVSFWPSNFSMVPESCFSLPLEEDDVAVPLLPAEADALLPPCPVDAEAPGSAWLLPERPVEELPVEEDPPVEDAAP
jgi:hypothetical protein